MENGDGMTFEQVEQLIDRRVEERLIELMGEQTGRVPDAIREGVSRREAMGMVAGGVAGYGIATVVGRDGSGSGTIVGEGDGDEEGGASAADLQQALEDESVVRIAGEIDVNGETPITVPQNTVLCGDGVYRPSLDAIGGDGLRAEDEGPILEITGNDTMIGGLALVNTGANGDAIRLAGYSSRITHTDVFSTRYGIDCNPDETATEPRLNFNRVVSTSGSNSESVGIRIENMHDAKVINNIVAGFDVEIDIQQSSALVSLNHTYTHPASESSVGVRIGAPGVRVVNNRIEGLSSRSGIEITAAARSIVSQNLIQVGAGADGITLDIGEELVNSFIMHNQIEGYSSDETGSTAIEGSAVQSFYRSIVGPNAPRHFDQEGVTGVVEAAGTDNVPEADRYFTYQIVENVDDGSVWIRSRDGMSRIA